MWRRTARRVVAGALDVVRTSLWPAPALGIALALAGAVGLTELDRAIDRDMHPATTRWIFGGDADAARSILGALAGSLITVTSLTFSLTVVTLQLASSQFSPRLLRTFTRDRVVQTTLALFLGTFVFALTVLRTVRTESDGAAEFVPRISVTTAYGLTIASVVGLVLFLAHLAEEIRVERMVRTVHADARDTVRFALKGIESAEEHLRPPAHAVSLSASRSGFVTGVDSDQLQKGIAGAGEMILVDVAAGASVIEGTPLAYVWRDDGRPLDDERRKKVQGLVGSAVSVSFERTSVDDVAFGLRQLTDVAVKALSPGINDPTTATHTLSHSAALLCMLCHLPLGDEIVRDKVGQVRVIVRRPALADLLALAVDQPLRYGVDEPQVAERLYKLLQEVAWHSSRTGHHAAIRGELDRLTAAVRQSEVDDAQQQRYDALHQHVVAALDGHWRGEPQEHQRQDARTWSDRHPVSRGDEGKGRL